jgi:SAM-dependent methyltransferase
MEGLPLALVGALICGRVPIVTDIGAHSEVIDDNITGFIAKMPTIESLDEALERAFQKSEMWEDIGRKSREKILSIIPDDPIDDFISKILPFVNKKVLSTFLKSKNKIDYNLGCRLPVDDWVYLNRTAAFNKPDLRKYVGPFPPTELMENTTGSTKESDFASTGADIWIALSQASPKPLSEFESILDFGCGCGRLARMFKGYTGHFAGCDIDHRHIDWCTSNMAYMEAKLSSVQQPIPFADDEFEAVISISIFSHLNESSQDQFLQELRRVCKPEGILFLTIHGRRALERANSEPQIKTMLCVDENLFQRARTEFYKGQHAFILQHGHLTTVTENNEVRTDKVISERFEYGITFIPEIYLRSHWIKWFDIIDYRVGGINDWQDIVVLKPKKIR